MFYFYPSFILPAAEQNPAHPFSLITDSAFQKNGTIHAIFLFKQENILIMSPR
jgi:hypothetical protein